MAPHDANSLRRAVESQLGERVKRFRRATRSPRQSGLLSRELRRGVLTYEVLTIDGLGLMVKAGPDQTIAVEAKVLETALKAGARVPRVLLSDFTQSIFPSFWFVTERVDGTPLQRTDFKSIEAEQQALDEVTESLARIHSVQLNGYGRPEPDRATKGEGLRGELGSWKEHLSIAAEWALPYLLKKDTLTDSTARSLKSAIAKEEWDSAPGRLLHGDLGVEHLLIDPKNLRLAGIIDFGDALIGDPDWDLARLAVDRPDDSSRMWERPPQRLGSDRPFDGRRMQIYVALWAVLKSRWRHEHGLNPVGTLRLAEEATLAIDGG